MKTFRNISQTKSLSIRAKEAFSRTGKTMTNKGDRYITEPMFVYYVPNQEFANELRKYLNN